MKKNNKIILGAMGIIYLLAFIMFLSIYNQPINVDEQLEDAKALVKQVEATNKTLTADEQKAYDNAKTFIQSNENYEAAKKGAENQLVDYKKSAA